MNRKHPCIRGAIHALAPHDPSLALDLLRFGGYTKRAALQELAKMTTSQETTSCV